MNHTRLPPPLSLGIGCQGVGPSQLQSALHLFRRLSLKTLGGESMPVVVNVLVSDLFDFRSTEASPLSSSPTADHRSPISKKVKGRETRRSTDQYGWAEHVAVLTPAACWPGTLPGVLPGRSRETVHLEAGFALRCFQRFSLPDIANQRLPLAGQLVHQRSVHSGPLVLGAAPLNRLTPMMDRDRTVSRRSEPSSRAVLMGEQPNPWDRIQPQDTTSRHRGAKPCRRCERLGKISLLSPG